MGNIKGKYLVKHIQKRDSGYGEVDYTCETLIEVGRLVETLKMFANKNHYNDFNVNYIED